ncbi:MAG: TonB-system energizer ExbB [Fibrobacterota bacterium]
MDWIKAIIDYGIIGFLGLLSILALGIAIERYCVLRRIQVMDYRDKRELELVITGKLHVIASIGSSAPYIGLLGTVLGIMLTFYTMGERGFMDSSRIMIGLALALKATAMGLLVAIPSVVAYNTLMRKAKVLLLAWDIEHGKKNG